MIIRRILLIIVSRGSRRPGNNIDTVTASWLSASPANNAPVTEAQTVLADWNKLHLLNRKPRGGLQARNTEQENIIYF